MGSKKDTVIRFAVGTAGAEISSTWRVWFNKLGEKSTSDVYLSYRSLGGTLKVSIHESGIIQYSFTGEHAKKLSIPNQDRHLDRWDLQGKHPVFKIIVPFSELKIAPNQKPKKVSFINAPANGNAVEIYIYITPKQISSIMPEEFTLLAENKLTNGKIISLIWRDIPITENNSKLYLTHKDELKEVVINNSIKGGDLRGFLYLKNGDNERGFIDIAM